MMKDMKKKIVTTSLGAMALVSGLTGCNSNTKQVTDTEKASITTEVPTTEETTLSAAYLSENLDILVFLFLQLLAYFYLIHI